MLYKNTHKHRISYFKSTPTFLGPAKFRKCLSTARQKPGNSCDFFIINIKECAVAHSLSLASQTLYLIATRGKGLVIMHAPISFSPPETGGTYFACIAYVEGVVFQLKLWDVHFRATFFFVLCGVRL